MEWQSGPVFYPVISSMQRMALYETKMRFYLVGSNNVQTKFRVLKIDKSDSNELHIEDDKTEYTQNEIHDLIHTIDSENRLKQSTTNGPPIRISAFGIVGFVRFLSGYYIILITRRCKVATIGYHSIYKIENVVMISIGGDYNRTEQNTDEARYVKMFQNIDLASNFYFSYSYDLTHSLQHNLIDPKKLLLPCISTDKQIPFSLGKMNEHFKDDLFGIRVEPYKKFVWNSYLLKPVQTELHADWILHITHGFIAQSNVSVFGRSIYITLIARRSAKYAGTRFLKRGANYQGDVANEVETEQIVFDAGVSLFAKGNFTSFVQMRGSIPGHWKQYMGKMVGKPAIMIDTYDPYAETSGRHFNRILSRFGAPLIVLNLVKQRERKKHERLLSDELSCAIKYLNQFLPNKYQIIYKTFDMARKTKANINVIALLENIAKNLVLKTGIFRSGRSDQCSASLQSGIIRTNCVDCLDRTNTAQFIVGKCALKYQLYALGILGEETDLQFDTDCVRMLENLYEDHGDTLALQYGGSQLVHRIKTYRKTAPWTSQGNDIMQTLSRYYSNTFSDAEKQNTINLFLGLFIPEMDKAPIWEWPTDHFLHNQQQNVEDSTYSLTKWWDNESAQVLPQAYLDMSKTCSEIVQVYSNQMEMIDAYVDYYRPYELSVLNETFASTISHSIRDFMPNFTNDYSPFAIRIRPVKRREQYSNKSQNIKNPSIGGQSSIGTTSSSSSSSEDISYVDEDSTCLSESQCTNWNKENNDKQFSFKNLFPSMKEIYGVELLATNSTDMDMYKRYSAFAVQNTTPEIDSIPISFDIKSHFFIEQKHISIPKQYKVDSVSKSIYSQYVLKGTKGADMPSRHNMDIYEKYAKHHRINK